MPTIPMVILVLVLLGGGGYYGHRRYGAGGLGRVLGLPVVVVTVVWLLGPLGIAGIR